MSKNIGKNITKILSSIYSQKSFNHAKQSDADSFKTTSKIPISKTAKATVDLIGLLVIKSLIKLYGGVDIWNYMKPCVF